MFYYEPGRGFMNKVEMRLAFLFTNWLASVIKYTPVTS